MSQWDKPTSRATVLPIKGREKDKNKVIVPHVALTENLAAFADDLEKLRTNNGQYRSALDPLLGPECGDVVAVTPVLRADDSVAYLELRMKRRIPHPSLPDKTYRIIYRGDVFNSDNPKDDGLNRLCVGIDPLAQHGLLIPTNCKALLDAVAAYKAGLALRPAFLWAEGEKARLGLQRRVETPEALSAFAARGLIPVTAATLSGKPGAQWTNYSLTPGPEIAARYIVSGRNDVALDLTVALHILVPDADNIGHHEAYAVGDRLTCYYAVDPENVRTAATPPGAPLSWDDADALPRDVTAADRIAQLLDAWPYRERWIYKTPKTPKSKPIIDVMHMANRRRALKMAGVHESHTDCVTGRPLLQTSCQWRDPNCPDDDELHALAEVALAKMDHEPTLYHMGRWRESLNSLRVGRWRDTIHEETLALIEAGRPRMSDANRPERLFIEMFGLPDDLYTRLAGWHLIRDALALRLRPAFHAPAVIPQLLFVFYGPEGCGKSTAVKVLSGASPSPHDDAPRYTDKVSLADLAGTPMHGDLSLARKIIGMTAIELADKSLGVDVSRTRADVLKHFANTGVLYFRPMYGRTDITLSARGVRVFTTNNPHILTQDMGSRRWVALDVTKSTWPDAATIAARLNGRTPTAFEAARLKNHNPGLDWAHANLGAMFAHMYDSGAHLGDLHATAEFAALFVSYQSKFIACENWQFVFAAELERIEAAKTVAVRPEQFAQYSLDAFGSRAPSPQAMAAVLKPRGWHTDVQWLDGKSRRVWHFCEKFADVDRYAIWFGKDGGSPGKWTVQAEPSSAALKTMQAFGIDDPF